MKNKIEVEKIKVVTKDNFQLYLKDFKEALESKLLDYIIINNDISTSKEKIQEKEGEIIFSEFTFVKSVNLAKKDINYTFTTFLVPSLKFHRYSNDEIVSFNSMFLKYLTNEKYIYGFNQINSPISISYENIHKRKELEKSLNLILKDGKPFKKENKTSYYYYPKAFELPSKKYQKKFEDLLKFFVGQNFDENAKKIESEDKSTFVYESDKYVSDFKFLNSFLDFKWGQIFDKIDSDAYKVFVNGYKIIFNSQEIKFSPSFLKFVEEIKNFLESDRSIDNFELEIKPDEDTDLNDEFFKNWKQYIMTEEYIAEFSYEFSDKNKIVFKLKADKTKEKKDKYQNVMKFLSFIISVPNKIIDGKEFKIDHIFFRRINMKNLFPEKMKNNIDFNYHLISRIEPNKFRLEKSKEFYFSKISYKKLFINNKNEEEILFGYKLEPQLKQLLEVKDIEKAAEEIKNPNVQPKTKTISLEFGKDLEILLKNEDFKKILDGYYSKFNLSKDTELNTKFKSVNYIIIKIPNFKDKDFKNDFESLLNKAKEIKKKNLLDEEIGLSYFYDELFKKENINIYGCNLKNKIYFAIKQLLLEPSKNTEEEVLNILKKVNIYDISYICKKKNNDFFKKYLELKKDEELKERTMTQRLGYIIEETEILKNRENLNEYKNKFYFDEKENISKNHFICIEKDKFYEKADNIIDILKKKTDFTVNKSPHDNNVFELNIIDPGKYSEIKNIAQEVDTC